MTNKEKFLTLVSPDEGNTAAWITERQANRELHRTSQKIALLILKRLSDLNWKQKDLAERMNVSPQQVSKWVKGKENFRIETLLHLGEVLGIALFHIPPIADDYNLAESNVSLLNEGDKE
ncbi:helix-turn-helix transcriptional regulator [Myroides phaeus]|uniref:Helix-turn-helix n=1 Tax=Myroides phaeus TaxID=702745 RepID=A0A1G8CGB3_9FLAO|nr:helix-turn-helix transcriptional regulator [Myroides phaeus]SDH44506.1 Helix-turn-helix [Myroides phaeus]